MKKKILLALSFAAGVVLISLAADPAGGKLKEGEGDTVREMRSQIIELRAEVETLRQRTQRLESTVDDLRRSRVPSPLNLQQGPTTLVPSPTSIPLPEGSRPPTVWGQGEVNGWTYYVVPCEQRGR